MNLDASPGWNAVMGEELLCERLRPAAILSFDCEGVRRSRRYQQRRRRSSRANPAEPSSRRPAEVEDAEVQACVRLDTDRIACAHDPVAAQERLLITLPATTAA
jgi:hypothetical protein